MKKCQKKKKSCVRLLDRFLIAVLAVAFLSGMLLYPLQEVSAIQGLHKLSALLLVVGVIVHIVQHRKGKCRE